MKQFAYVDEYDSRQAPNRRIKRLIEADNQKARNKERGKFNDKIRDLLYHMKQKDLRYQQFLSEDLAIKEAKMREIEEAKEEKRKFEAERLRIYREELAEQNRKLEEEASEEEIFVDEFEC